VTEDEHVDQCRNRGRERHREDDGEPAEEHAHDRDRQERHERRQPDRLADVGVDDVALELADSQTRSAIAAPTTRKWRRIATDWETRWRSRHSTPGRIAAASLPRGAAG
jgi:hypothetical protein